MFSKHSHVEVMVSSVFCLLRGRGVVERICLFLEGKNEKQKKIVVIEFIDNENVVLVWKKHSSKTKDLSNEHVLLLHVATKY